MGEGAALACAAGWLMVLGVYDVRQRRLPNALTLPGAVAVMVVAALAGRGSAALFGAVALTALYLVVHLIAPAAMGAGDVKLALGVGALSGAFGIDAWVLAAIGAPLLTAVWGVVAMRSRGAGASGAPLLTAVWGVVAMRSRGAGASGATGEFTVPHGPSMCVATIAAVALVVV
jgi:leader peptidase (prepilin peptidase)/N-methyltransferase